MGIKDRLDKVVGAINALRGFADLFPYDSVLEIMGALEIERDHLAAEIEERDAQFAAEIERSDQIQAYTAKEEAQERGRPLAESL